MITVFGENSCDNFVTFYFTPYGDFFGDLPELVTIKVIVWSPRLVTMHVTILSLFVSPNMVIFKVIHRIFLTKCHLNWWKSSGFTNLGDNPIENVLGLLYEFLGPFLGPLGTQVRHIQYSWQVLKAILWQDSTLSLPHQNGCIQITTFDHVMQ